MKSIIAAGIMVLGLSAAHADQVALNAIPNQNCTNGTKNVDLLATKVTSVDGECTDGTLYTTVNYAGPLTPGTTLQLGNIDTNDCARLQTFISLLSTAQVTVTAVCSAYVYQGYQSSDGRVFNYRLYTKMIINN